ncbi:unnamed protein product [Acidithrix sp. C25]|nr:unnamed protein product [Acidithrix sp. C25]
MAKLPISLAPLAIKYYLGEDTTLKNSIRKNQARLVSR